MSNRLLATLALALCLTITLFLWAPLPGTGQSSATADLTAPVTSINCDPCHARIAETDVPGLVFSHGNHLLVDCRACHVRAPHEEGATYRPVMDVCFACHGLEHGPQGILAAGECVDCHTPRHTMRPASHVKDWAGEPHADFAVREGTNRCMMCHDARADCDECHAVEAPGVLGITPVYFRNVPAEEERVSVPLDTRTVPTMGSCVFCHPEIDRTDNGRIVFEHDPHLRRDFKCEACHEVFPHQPDRTIVPDMQSCYRCHSLQHAGWGDVATEDCLACHPANFQLVPVDHTPEFVIGGHKDSANADVKRCTMCHVSSFCVPCHNGQAELANGATSPVVIPEDHRKPEWKPDHGRLFLGQEGSCSVCHTQQYCTTCHVTAMPHPAQWVTTHADNGYPQDDCRVCHEDRETCQECHHSQVESNVLARENCVDCHEEMKTEPPTAIKNIGLAEHAVHFDVEERVGRTYVCSDCHIGFTVARVMQPSQQTQVHDLRICYDCHGNLDVNNRIIAPYPGSELCRRCHTDLKI